MKADIIACPSTIHGFVVKVERKGKWPRRYYMDLITPSSAGRLCAILNKMRPIVEWDGFEPAIYYFASQQEGNR